MNCIDVKKKLSRYQDMELENKEHNLIALHLKTCTSCKQEFAELENVISNMKNVEQVSTPLYFEQKIMAQIYEKETKKHSFLPSKLASLVYSIIFVFFLSFGLLFIDINQTERKPLINDNTLYITSILANEQELGLLDIQNNIIDLIENEVNDEN